MNSAPIYAVFLAACLVSGAVAATTSDAECMKCHDRPQTRRDAPKARKTPAFDENTQRRSVHAELSCLDCHQDAKADEHEAGLGVVDCGSCHPKADARLRDSVHGPKEGRSAVACKDCHGTHDMPPADDPRSMLYPTRLPQTCSTCHGAGKSAPSRKHGLSVSQYVKSVHYTGLTDDGLLVSATCTSCHGTHETRAATDAASKVSRRNVPGTCGECHQGIFEQYEQSVHGQALARGSTETPVCTDCHGEHAIVDHQDAESNVHAAKISKTTCPQCHSAEHVNRKYGLPTTQVEGYRASFHGLADRFGDTTVANCASCHGAHAILKSSNPKSAVNAANLPKTCGKCHPGASTNFARGSVHEPTRAAGGIVLRYVRLFYVWMIGLTVGAMLLHNLLDYGASVRAHYRANRRKRRFLRFELGERIQHLLLVVSFCVLVFSGFALKYPDAFWVEPIVDSALSFMVRGYAHRIAAVVFVGLCIYHAYYAFFTERGKSQFKAMLPRRGDGRDVRQQLRYYFGLERRPAQFGRYSYVEKFEYLALIWGSIVMILTGLILWFEVDALRWMPKWGWDLAELVHLYEAWLATLSIAIWHFYHVIFKPSKHGVSLAMATGELTEEEMEHEHTAELEAVRARKQGDVDTSTVASDCEPPAIHSVLIPKPR